MKHAGEDSTQTGAWDELWEKRGELADWDYLSHVIFAEIQKFYSHRPAARILEAGSGSGRISARISSSQTSVFQLDNSFSSLMLNFRRNQKGKLLAADIRQVPIKNNYFDVVWSSGVLEHFTELEQVAVLAELGRVTQPGGVVVTLVPYSKCAPYRAAKWIMEKTGLWPYGREVPLLSMKKQCEDAGLLVKSEYTMAFTTLGIQNLNYIPGIRSIGRGLNTLACWFHSMGLLRLLDRITSWCFGGYLLVCIAERK